MTTCKPGASRTGTVGRPLPGVHVKIERDCPRAKEGEVLTRGPHVMKGYYKRPAETAAMLDREGWYRTGDVGFLDRQGYLTITGRKTNLLVLGSGKRVHAEEVEVALSASPMLKEVCVVSDTARGGVHGDHDAVCAVCVPSDALRAIHGDDIDALRAALEPELSLRARRLAAFKRPTSIVVRLSPLTRSSGKVRRGELLRELSLGAAQGQTFP